MDPSIKASTNALLALRLNLQEQTELRLFRALELAVKVDVETCGDISAEGADQILEFLKDIAAVRAGGETMMKRSLEILSALTELK